MTTPITRSEKSDNGDSLRVQGKNPESPEGQRIREALHRLGPNHDAPWLARETKVPQSSIYDIIRRGFRRTEHAVAISDALGVSVDWLLRGMDSNSDRSEPIETGAGPSDRRPVKRRRDYDDELAEVAEIDPSFGLGGVIMDEHAAPEVRIFSRSWLRQITKSPPEELYWARGRGNSMSPTIEEGEPVLIDRMQHSVRDSDLIWAFAWGDVGAIKRLRPMPDGSVKILSDNPAVPPDVAHGSEIHILGRVVAVVKNL